MPAEFVDPYIDPETGILRNLVGARTDEELRYAEGEFAALRIAEFLERMPFRVTGTLDDFRAIHCALFQDVFDWAGKVRTVEIRKNRAGSEFFLPSTSIATGMRWSQGELLGDNMLQGMQRDVFCERLAYHYDNYNFVHPFREGNGRTQRLFWTLLCHDAGFDLRWQEVSGDENDEASRLAAEERDYAALIAMFERIACPCDPRVPLNFELVSASHLRDRR